MADVTDSYLPFTSDGVRIPSAFTVYLPGWSPCPSSEEVAEALRRSGCETPRVVGGTDGWRIDFADGEIEPEPSDELTALHFSPGALNEETQRAVENSVHSLRYTTTFGGGVLEDFHAALKLMSAFAPNAVAIFDHASCRAHSGEWLHAAARSKVPPPPISLYTVHAVRGDTIWMHTHGLLRCGSIELEILDLPAVDEAHDLMLLLNATATMFIEQGVPDPGSPFSVGRDLDLVWEPWEVAIAGHDADRLGGTADRDEYHEHPSGVLFAPKKKMLGLFGKPRQSPLVYLDVLADNPLLYHSRMETQRMSLLAVERFPVFRDLERRFQGEEDWSFAAKFGYCIDDDRDQTEHLWFAVHSIEGGRVEATLLNRPYGIARMNEGDRGWHPIDGLSDWTIYAPAGAFRPDNVDELIALLDD